MKKIDGETVFVCLLAILILLGIAACIVAIWLEVLTHYNLV